MTTYFRFKGPEPPVMNYPALADIMRRLDARPGWNRDQPLVVEPDLWAQAESEMIEGKRLRGYNEIARAGIPERNFLFCGSIIVAKDK